MVQTIEFFFIVLFTHENIPFLLKESVLKKVEIIGTNVFTVGDLGPGCAKLPFKPS